MNRMVLNRVFSSALWQRHGQDRGIDETPRMYKQSTLAPLFHVYYPLFRLKRELAAERICLLLKLTNRLRLDVGI